MKLQSEKSERTLESLRQSVRNALKRKAQLGQYAVIWKEGKVHYLGNQDAQWKGEAVSDELQKQRD